MVRQEEAMMGLYADKRDRVSAHEDLRLIVVGKEVNTIHRLYLLLHRRHLLKGISQTKRRMRPC